MTLKRALPFFVIVLTLTGCFRQAGDTFDTVDSSTGSNDTAEQIINPTPTEEAAITIIAPGMDDLTPEETEIVSADVDDDTSSEQAATDMPSTPTNPPPPTDDTSAETVPTATDAVTFITPEPVIENEIPTATPTIEVTRNPALQPTPSDETAAIEEEPVGECEYVVQAGDNAFRIALNNDVSLDALLSANDLPPDPIIQPGQRLIIPGCVEGASASTEAEATEDVSAAVETTEEPTEPLADGYRLHVVAPGETLLSIARQYDVTVNDIIAENPDLSDPNRISQGQELLIPPADE